MNNFYVYIYLDQYNIPFYVGKGCKKRYQVMWHIFDSRPNLFLKNKIRKIGQSNIKVHFLHTNLSEEESFYWERYWIKYIGRRDKKEGSLYNLTDGGEGVGGLRQSEEHKHKISIANKGHKHSEETKRKMSIANKGNKYALGYKHTEETKRKMALTKIGKKHTEEAKQKISEALQGHTNNKGKVHSKETRKKMSYMQKLRRIREQGITSC